MYKIESKIMASSEKKLKKPLGTLNIDWDTFDDKDADGNYYIAEDVVSTRRKSVYLPGWAGDDIKAVDEQLTIYTEVPIMCKGSECQFVDICPLIKNKLVGRWIGKACPIEIVQAFRFFAGYVNDLDIKPMDFTDIQMINDLVRNQILMSRCDKLLRKEKPIEMLVSGTDTKTGLKHEARQPNQLIAQQRMIRGDIDKLYQRLMASRQSKVEIASKSRFKEDISNSMADILDMAKKMGIDTKHDLDIEESNEDIEDVSEYRRNIEFN